MATLSSPAAAINTRLNAILAWDGPGLAKPGVLIKDCIDIAGTVTSQGSRIPRAPATADAHVVTRLRAAGLAIAGKAHLSEFCFGATGENAHFGNCRNPWDTNRITGGSSSGSAAAVAAGLVRWSLGTDTGGSVRVPAALCGVVGLRPTFGRVSNAGVLDVSTICDTVGPIAATVRDAAQLFAIIAGHDPADPNSIASDADPLHAIDAGIGGLNIGILRTPCFENLQPAVAAAMAAAIHRFETLGARITDIDLPCADDLRANRAFQFVLADVADARRREYHDHAGDLGAEVRRRIELGKAVSGQDYAACIRALLRLKRDLRSVFATGIDIILTPTTPVTAPLWADAADMVATTRLVARNTYDLGAAGVPSLSIPAGHDGNGLPIGVQLTAAWNAEATLFRAGQAFEAATDHHRRRPAIHLAG